MVYNPQAIPPLLEYPIGQILNFVFKSNIDKNLSEILEINSELTRAEAYLLNDGMYETLDIKLNKTVDKLNVILHQNSPNPFKDYTEISFELPQDADVELNIYDITGKMIKSINEK